ncbi:MAG: LamG-like jellyroll fold domain-containing protein [Phycisphaerales bacterium]
MSFNKKILILVCILTTLSAKATMVAHWDFNGASGTTVVDSVGGYNATINGGAYLNNSGKLTLDGVDDYVSMPVGAVVSGLNSFSITAKINFSGQGSSWQRIFSFGNSTEEFMNLAFTNTADNEILLKCRHDEHDEITYATSDFSLAGEHYLAITLDSTNKIARIYIDGQIIGQNKYAEFKPSFLGSTANNWLGKSEYSTGAYFKGSFDDLCIYDNVLTPAQVSQTAGYNGAIEPNPSHKQMGIDLNVTLGWGATSGSSFDVYFGNSLSSVTNANNTMPVGDLYKGRINQTTFAVSDLNPKTTYYWRVDEINAQGNPVKGKVWRFTTIPAGVPIKVMCYNIRYDNLAGVPSLTDANAWIYAFGTDRKERVLNMITSGIGLFDCTTADIIGLQEVTSNQKNDVQNVLTDFGFYGVIGDAEIEYCPIFYRSSRFTLQNSGTFWLSETPDTPGSIYPGAGYARIASWVILRDAQTQQSYFVMNTHWDHISKEANYYTAGLIRTRVAQYANGLPVIIMGDLNTQETENAFLRLMGDEDPAGMQLSDTYRSLYPAIKDDEVTCHGWKGGSYGHRIDFIVHDDAFYTGKADIEHGKGLDSRYPSDHYPVNAILYYRQYLDGDINKDGVVNFKDFFFFSTDWLDSGYYLPSDQVGLVGHWDFEGPAGTTIVADRAGNNNATIIGSSLNGSGGVDLAGGSNVQYVDLGSGLGSVIAGLMDSTVIIDFAWDGYSAGTYQKPWTFSQAGTTQFAFITFVNTNDSYIRYQHRYSAHDETADAETPLLTGRHQIAIANNSAYGEKGSVQIYVDGLQEAFHTQEFRADLSLLGATTRNYLGKSPYDAGKYFDGTIYDFRIYNRYLSADEIADIYNGTSEQIYVPLDSSSNFYDDDIINFLDFAVFADSWLESM